MCLCYYILGFAAYSIISGDDSDYEYPFDMNPYDQMGNSTDLEECADEFYA